MMNDDDNDNNDEEEEEEDGDFEVHWNESFPKLYC